MTPRLISLSVVSFSVAATLTLLLAAEACEPEEAGETASAGAGDGSKSRAASLSGARNSGASGSGATGSSGRVGPEGSADAPAVIHDRAGVIVVLGSSTSAGTGPQVSANAWVERYRSYLKGAFPNFQLINLSVGGYTTYQVQPSDYVPAAGRPQPDKAHNITFALTLQPDALVINLPSNDANDNYPAEEQLANFDRVTRLAEQSGVACWVATSQPRNFTGDPPATRQSKWRLLINLRDALQHKYGDRTLDFWTPFAEPGGKLKATWDAGDGTHLNDAAHALLVEQVIAAKIPEAILTAKP